MDKIWNALAEYRKAHAGNRIEDLFADPSRVNHFSTEACGVFLDFSKTAIDADARALLLSLAEASGIEARRDALFAGEAVNRTEGRAALHMALRSEADALWLDGCNIMDGIAETLARMQDFARSVREGQFRPAGKPVRDVVNIGIGGSDLGPAMAGCALSPWADGPRLHCVSNVDGADLHDRLRDFDPETTLFVIVSKTFTTVETMTNARAARDWLTGRVTRPADHFVAVSSAVALARDFGIPEARIFGFGDWVGGRYSVWGPVGLALMIAIGPEEFDQIRAGGRAMDQHFLTAPMDRNLPVWLALTGIWHHQICGYPTRAILPYAARLALFPAYLQQLEMESNGKGVTMAGEALTRTASPVIWGDVGTNGQHAFMQLIHQGRQVVPCEFILFAEGVDASITGDDRQQKLLLANGLAQAQALMRGRSAEAARKNLPADLAPDQAEILARHRAFPGNRPSVTMAARRLDPFTLGALIALYEHRVFVEGVILGINSFDQWGVELGKELAETLAPLLSGGEAEGQDASTLHLAARLREWAEN